MVVKILSSQIANVDKRGINFHIFVVSGRYLGPASNIVADGEYLEVTLVRWDVLVLKELRLIG